MSAHIFRLIDNRWPQYLRWRQNGPEWQNCDHYLVLCLWWKRLPRHFHGLCPLVFHAPGRKPATQKSPNNWL